MICTLGIDSGRIYGKPDSQSFGGRPKAPQHCPETRSFDSPSSTKRGNRRFPVSNRVGSIGEALVFEVSSAPLGLVEQHPTRDIFEKNPIVELPGTRVDDERNLGAAYTPSPEDRVFGNLHVRREKRPYERHCTWCFESIAERQMALVIDGARKGRPRFCSDDCFQNWESLYWQRLAISHLGLTSEEFKQQQRDLRLQRRFSRFR